MTGDIKKNKVRNEEYKIWKKSVPFLYQHISSVRPKFSSRVDDALKSEKRLTFSDKVIPDKKKGLLSTTALYSQGSDVYEIDCDLPLGAFYPKAGDKDDKKALPDPDYGDAFARAQEEVPQAKWTFLGESITKISYMGSGPGDSNLLAMSKNGSLAWFRDGIKVPVHIMQEIMGPGTSFSSIHSYTTPEQLSVSDFALSEDYETLVKCQSNGKEEESILKVVDNSGSPGDVLRTIRIPAAVTNTVRFFDNHLFATCSDDNVLRFWDTRTEGKPLWDLTDPNHGKILSFGVSPVVDTLFATGTDTGIVKVWDVRAVVAAMDDYSKRQHGQDPVQNELINFYHSGGDSVVDVQFSHTSSSEFLTVGGSGNVYQWDLDYFFSEYGEKTADTLDMDIAKADILQSQCLKFLHTGGSRRSVGHNGKRNTVAYHPVIDDLVGVVDQDSLITVYKAFTGREDDQKEAEEAESQADATTEE